MRKENAKQHWHDCHIGKVTFIYHVCFVQGADSKREEFRKYLEKAGVLDALTKGKAEFIIDQ